ncbi:hypothetical protein RN001_010985 [Aquatica leii]|uniref:Flap endonuclease GEN n=1 Tax=Aquatica leii TaxID=1421715 RepID=A0AAN7PVI0_9COLE|nr:hypothetical protein RN001_010985 [Aquatica leii]
MGIKHLWSILSPFGERKPLYELQGKTVAIDLSCWVCEAQNVTDNNIQPKMYLRNLYFRTCYLLLMQVNPVFVLEGKAPQLKLGTIASRNAIQFKDTKSKHNPKTVRSRFNTVLRSCEEMLQCMGIACVKGTGEAESLCAYLNEDGLVHGCISQDSDCFAYGAKIVYRNFSISQQGAQAGAGAVDVYDIHKIMNETKFGRNKMIALALLCGSDYGTGVFGIGKEAALKLFECVSDDEILDRIKTWRNNSHIYEIFQKELADKNVCSSCGHGGKVQSHIKNGCVKCSTTKGCDFSKFKNKCLQIKNEVNIRNKALEDPNFPSEEIINEFLIRKDNVSKLNLQWTQPDLTKFVKFAVKHLQWEYVYAFEKFLPILTRWQLLHKINVITPSVIKKVRNPKGVPSFEIIWTDSKGLYNELIPTNELLDVNLEKLWSTIEPQQLVVNTYPDLVRMFEESKAKPKKRKKVKNTIDDIDKMLANTSISEPKVKKGKCKTIESYFKKAVMNNFKSEKVSNSEQNDSFNLDLSKFGDESDLDLSDVVDEIVSRKLNYLEKVSDSTNINLNTSTFFITEAVDEDLFEQSMVVTKDSSDEEEDSFVAEYVPLLTRLQCKS